MRDLHNSFYRRFALNRQLLLNDLGSRLTLSWGSLLFFIDFNRLSNFFLRDRLGWLWLFFFLLNDGHNLCKFVLLKIVFGWLWVWSAIAVAILVACSHLNQLFVCGKLALYFGELNADLGRFSCLSYLSCFASFLEFLNLFFHIYLLVDKQGV